MHGRTPPKERKPIINIEGSSEEEPRHVDTAECKRLLNSITEG